MKILIVGGATRDIFIQPIHSPAIQFFCNNTQSIVINSGTKIDVENIIFQTGGGATNAAVSFTRLGFDVSVACKVADDEAGAAVLADLKKNNVKTDLIISGLSSRSWVEQRLIEVNVSTGTSFIFQVPSGDNPILAYRGINTQLTLADVAPHIPQAQHMYITSLSGAASSMLLPLTQEAKKHGVFVATNPGGSQLAAGADMLRKSLPYMDVLILNMHEAEIFMSSLEQIQKNSFNLSDFFKKILDAGVRIVVVTDGAHGVHVATQEYIYFCPSMPVKLVSSVGAGDAFGSCFVATILQGKNIEQAIVSGMINSASVLTHVGAKVGLLSQAVLEKRCRKVELLMYEKENGRSEIFSFFVTYKDSTLFLPNFPPQASQMLPEKQV